MEHNIELTKMQERLYKIISNECSILSTFITKEYYDFYIQTENDKILHYRLYRNSDKYEEI